MYRPVSPSVDPTSLTLDGAWLLGGSHFALEPPPGGVTEEVPSYRLDRYLDVRSASSVVGTQQLHVICRLVVHALTLPPLHTLSSQHETVNVCGQLSNC